MNLTTLLGWLMWVPGLFPLFLPWVFLDAHGANRCGLGTVAVHALWSGLQMAVLVLTLFT